MEIRDPRMDERTEFIFWLREWQRLLRRKSTSSLRGQRDKP